MNLSLSGPFFIGTGLAPALKFGTGMQAGTIQLQYDGRTDDNRIRFRWEIVLETPAGHKLFEGNDLHSGCGEKVTPAALQDGFRALLDFLVAAAEAYRYAMGHKESDNDQIFPAEVCEWAYINSDDIGMCGLFLQQQQYINAA